MVITDLASREQLRFPSCGGRILVSGDSRVAQSLFAVLSVVISRREVVRLHDELELKLEVQRNAISSEEPDVVVAVINEGKGQLTQRIFQLHSALRRQFTYAGQTYSWVGGLVGVAAGATDAHELDRHPLFSTLSGHRLVTSRGLLIHFAEAVGDVGLLFPRAWAFAIQRSGLAAFWKLIADSQTRLESADLDGCETNLSGALAELLDNNRLRQLLPHNSVVSALDKLRRRLDTISGEPVVRRSSLEALLDEINGVMAQYRIDLGD